MKNISRLYSIYLLAALILATTPARAALVPPAPEPVLIVENIVPGSPVASAGLQVNDRLLSYDGRPLPSFAALQASVQNLVGKKEVVLRLQRGDRTLALTVPSGTLGIQARLDLPPAALALYNKGLAAMSGSPSDQALSHWKLAADAAQQGGYRAAAGELYYRIGVLYEMLDRINEARAMHEAAWKLAEGGDDPAAQSQYLVALGRCGYEVKDYPAAARFYEQAVGVSSAAGYEVWAANYLMELGTIALITADDKAAHAYSERAVKILERLIPESLELSTALNMLAGTSVTQKDFPAARRYYERSLKIRERVRPESLPVAYSLNGLARVAFREGDLDTARKHSEHALKIRERLAPGSMDESYSLSLLGEITLKKGEFRAARKYYERILDIYERQHTDPLSIAGTLYYLGNITLTLSDYQAAQDYYQRALAIFEQLEPDSEGVANSLHNLGEVASFRGDLSAGQKYCERALALAQRVGQNSHAVGISNNCLGGVAMSRGDIQAAQTYYGRALEVFQRLPPGDEVLDSVSTGFLNLGNVAYARGDLQMAQTYYERSLETAEQESPGSLSVAFPLTGLGVVTEGQGDLQGAQKYFQRALAIREHQAPESFTAATSLHNLGVNALKRHDYEAADTYLTRALKLRERIAPGSPTVALLLNNLSIVSLSRGDRQTARAYLTRSVSIYKQLAPNSPELADVLNNFATLAFTDGKLTESLNFSTQAVEIIESHRSKILSLESRALFLGKFTKVYSRLIETQLALKDQASAFASIERARARSLVDLLGERQVNFKAEVPAELLSRQSELDGKRAAAYARLVKLSPDRDATLIEQLQKELATFLVQQRELEGLIRRASAKLAALKYPQPLDLKGAQALLDADTMLLAYYVSDDETYLFTVTKTDLKVFTLGVGEEKLNSIVMAFRNSISVKRPAMNDPSSLREAREQGKKLYDLLIRPAQERVMQARRILICPDGPLHVLPFAALVSRTEPELRYLIEDKPIHTIVSMTVYAEMRNAAIAGRQPKQTLLAFGDPLLPQLPSESSTAQMPLPGAIGHATEKSAGAGADSERASLLRQGFDMAPLPWARKEVKAIGQLYGNAATIKVGQEVTETTARQASGDYSILHFAVHGWMDDQIGLNSGLVFSQPELLGQAATGDDNGLWQAWEILEHLRLKADLVTLPACETGLGQEIRGEGIIGLTRAFQFAGARSIVVSLWNVNDESTSVLMTNFYERLRGGASKDEALRGAMLKVRHNPRWKHPFYWSTFTLVGEWR